MPVKKHLFTLGNDGVKRANEPVLVCSEIVNGLSSWVVWGRGVPDQIAGREVPGAEGRADLSAEGRLTDTIDPPDEEHFHLEPLQRGMVV